MGWTIFWIFQFGFVIVQIFLRGEVCSQCWRHACWPADSAVMISRSERCAGRTVRWGVCDGYGGCRYQRWWAKLYNRRGWKLFAWRASAATPVSHVGQLLGSSAKPDRRTRPLVELLRCRSIQSGHSRQFSVVYCSLFHSSIFCQGNSRWCGLRPSVLG